MNKFSFNGRSLIGSLFVLYVIFMALGYPQLNFIKRILLILGGLQTIFFIIQAFKERPPD